jgi:hypothetical protein
LAFLRQGLVVYVVQAGLELSPASTCLQGVEIIGMCAGGVVHEVECLLCKYLSLEFSPTKEREREIVGLCNHAQQK